ETHSERGDEFDGALHGGHTLPEPIAHRKIVEGITELGQVFAVKVHVPYLVARDPREAAAERRRRLGKSQNGPAKKLGGLELVMEKRVDELRAPRRRFHGLGPGCLASRTAHDELRRTSGARAGARWVVRFQHTRCFG